MSVTISIDDYATTLDNPEEGFITTIDMALDLVKSDVGRWNGFDNGAAHDRRTCRATFLMTAADALVLTNLIAGDWRGQNVLVTLNSIGFPIFGPDKGDTATFAFTCGLLMDDLDQSAIMSEPWKYIRVGMTFVNVGAYPSFTPPTDVIDMRGNFQIGTVQNIRYPQAHFSPSVRYLVKQAITEQPMVHHVDRSYRADQYETSFDLVCSQTKAAHLLKYLTGTSGRANAFNMITDTDHYAFGVDGGGNATYSVKFISPSISVFHLGYDLYKIGLSFAWDNFPGA